MVSGKRGELYYEGHFIGSTHYAHKDRPITHMCRVPSQNFLVDRFVIQDVTRKSYVVNYLDSIVLTIRDNDYAEVLYYKVHENVFQPRMRRYPLRQQKYICPKEFDRNLLSENYTEIKMRAKRRLFNYVVSV